MPDSHNFQSLPHFIFHDDISLQEKYIVFLKVIKDFSDLIVYLIIQEKNALFHRKEILIENIFLMFMKKICFYKIRNDIVPSLDNVD